MSIFEVIMLICFGAAWPISIMKSLKSKSNQGKSLHFLVIITIGYIAGILHKLYYFNDPVILLYVLNLVMIMIDIILYSRNKRLSAWKNGDQRVPLNARLSK